MRRKSDSRHFPHLLRHLEGLNIWFEVLRINKERFCAFHIIVLDSKKERRFAVDIPQMSLNSIRKQELHYFDIASYTCPH